jgi:putative membrane protein
MLIVGKILTVLVLMLHVYIVLLETLLFRSRGARVFQIPREHVDLMAPALSNQGCYNGFLVAALALGFLHPHPEIAQAFTVYGLICVAVAGIWGGLTVMRRILYIQTVPACLALLAFGLG